MSARNSTTSCHRNGETYRLQARLQSHTLAGLMWWQWSHDRMYSNAAFRCSLGWEVVLLTCSCVPCWNVFEFIWRFNSCFQYLCEKEAQREQYNDYTINDSGKSFLPSAQCLLSSTMFQCDTVWRQLSKSCTKIVSGFPSWCTNLRGFSHNFPLTALECTSPEGRL